MKLNYSLILIFFQFLNIIFLKFFDTSKIDLLGISNFSLFQTIKRISSTSLDPENSRFIIFKEALSLIKDRPLFGWGPSTFNFNFTNNNLNDANILSQNPYHTHNMPLELAYNFGIPLSLIIILTTSILLLLSIKKLYKIKGNKEEFLINKAWIISTLIIVITHLNDVTYYEDRIGILISIFFAGLRSFIKDNKIPTSH